MARPVMPVTTKPLGRATQLTAILQITQLSTMLTRAVNEIFFIAILPGKSSIWYRSVPSRGHGGSEIQLLFLLQFGLFLQLDLVKEHTHAAVDASVLAQLGQHKGRVAECVEGIAAEIGLNGLEDHHTGLGHLAADNKDLRIDGAGHSGEGLTHELSKALHHLRGGNVALLGGLADGLRSDLSLPQHAGRLGQLLQHHLGEDPKAQKEYGCAILVPEGSILPDVYKEEEYEFITYSDLYQAINSLDQERYDLVLFLSNTACALSPQFLNKIYNAYDAGVQAIQLHTIVENRKGIRNRFRAIREEIKNSLCRAGNTQFGLSSNLLGTNMAIDLKWLQKNMKSSKTNIERKLFRQNIYIDYLPDVIVYCQSAPACPYRKRIRKTTSYLLPSIFEGNWSFCNRIVQQLTPSPLKLCIFVSIWTSLITVYNWTLSFGWWIALFGLLITYSLAIPDYLVEDKKKKKHSIWRRKHLNSELKKTPA